MDINRRRLARSALGLTLGADVQPYNEILDSLSSGSLSSSKVEHGEYLIDSEGESGQIWTSDGDGKGSWAFPLIGEADVVGINVGLGYLGWRQWLSLLICRCGIRLWPNCSIRRWRKIAYIGWLITDKCDWLEM